MSWQKRRSSIEAFRNCPAQFNGIYRHGVRGDEDAARRGTVFHDAARLYTSALVRVQQRDNLDLAAAAFEQAETDHNLPWAEMQDYRDLWQRHTERWSLDLKRYVAHEQKAEPDGWSWTADLVYADADLLEIPDYKTHWAAWSATTAEAQFQAAFYLWRARKVFPGFRRYRLVFDFVRHNIQVPVELTDADLDLLEESVKRTEQAIEDAERAEREMRDTKKTHIGAELDVIWPARPGAHCRFCRVRCNVVDHSRRVPVRIENAEEAARVGAELFTYKRDVEVREQALRAWSDEHGKVEVAGATYGFWPHVVRRFPGDKVVKVLQDFGEELAFTLSASSLSKYLKTKKRAHIGSVLMTFSVEQSKTTFAA
jgi:hypothetical protein